MGYKIVRKNEAKPYEPPGHFGMLATRLHNPEDVNDGKMLFGLSHFLPGGGTEFSSNTFESIYYIVSGEMDIECEDGTKTTLYAGDTYHCGPNSKKCVKNNGAEAAKMLVCLLPT